MGERRPALGSKRGEVERDLSPEGGKVDDRLWSGHDGRCCLRQGLTQQ